MTELNQFYYCIIGGSINNCPMHDKCKASDYTSCPHRHHKWLTPEQFKEKYDAEYMDECPVWAWYNGWTLMSYHKAKDSQFKLVVCAYTPWGRPPEDWRPE